MLNMVVADLLGFSHTAAEESCPPDRDDVQLEAAVWRKVLC